MRINKQVGFKFTRNILYIFKHDNAMSILLITYLLLKLIFLDIFIHVKEFENVLKSLF